MIMNNIHKEHIMHSDIVQQIRNNNAKRIGEIVEKIKKAISPITNELQSAQKGDECMIIDMYIRKWNDMISKSTYHVNFWTSLTIDDATSHLWSHKDFVTSKFSIRQWEWGED